MVDLRTMQTVVVNGKFRVAVAKDEESFEAAVVGHHTDNPIYKAMVSAFSLGAVENPGWMQIDDSPRVKAAKKYTAVGEAIEAYLDQEPEENDQ